MPIGMRGSNAFFFKKRKSFIKIQLYGTVNWRANWLKTFYFEITIDLQEFAKTIQRNPVYPLGE